MAISAALVREEDRVQKPVHYTRYPPIKKLTFALVTAACKLKPYFQAHTIVVLIDKPLQQAMSSPKVTGQMVL